MTRRRADALPTVLLLSQLFLAAGGLFASGCASFVENLRPVVYGKSAKDNYERGMRSMKGESFLDAAKYFNFIKSNYPTSRWVPWAELGLSDAAFGRDAFIEAIDGYKTFISSHPRHEKVTDGYCAFKIGEAYYKQIPTDWFLVPPSYEKDQGPVYDAMRELRDFLDRYGKSSYSENARKMLGDTLQRLADHELYVARFYLDRNHPMAAIWRLEYVVNEYPGARRDSEVLILLGEVYLKQNAPKDARDAFRRLIIEHPTDFRAKQAQAYLDYINKRFGDLPPPAPLPPRQKRGPTSKPKVPDDDDELAPLAEPLD